MIKFGHFYIGNRFVVYDVGVEILDGRRRYVASLSEKPAIRFDAGDPADAIASLRRYLEQMDRFNAMQAA